MPQPAFSYKRAKEKQPKLLGEGGRGRGLNAYACVGAFRSPTLCLANTAMAINASGKDTKDTHSTVFQP